MSINAQPFSPTFKLVGNLSESQILVYDASENAFVNACSNNVILQQVTSNALVDYERTSLRGSMVHEYIMIKRCFLMLYGFEIPAPMCSNRITLPPRKNEIDPVTRRDSLADAPQGISREV